MLKEGDYLVTSNLTEQQFKTVLDIAEQQGWVNGGAENQFTYLVDTYTHMVVDVDSINFVANRFVAKKCKNELTFNQWIFSAAPADATHYNPDGRRANWYKLENDKWYYHHLNGKYVKSSNSEPEFFKKLIPRESVLPPIGSIVKIVGDGGDVVECICHTTDGEGEPIGVYRHHTGISMSIINEGVELISESPQDQLTSDIEHGGFIAVDGLAEHLIKLGWSKK